MSEQHSARWTLRMPACLVTGLLLGVTAFADDYPRPAGFVNDFANQLPVSTVQALEAKVRAYERVTGNEIAVAVVPSLNGMLVDDYARGLFHAWGVGKSAVNNGVLFLWAPHERRIRIEVGTDLEGVLTDTATGLIVERVRELFRSGRYADGVNAAVDRIIERLGMGQAAGASISVAMTTLPLHGRDGKRKSQYAPRPAFTRDQKWVGWPPVLVQGHKSGWPTKPPMESGCASTSPCSENEVLRTLPQLRVLHLGFLKDGNAGVGIFPEREEVLIRSPGFGRISRNNVGPSQPQMRQCAGQLVLNYAGVIEDLLELGGSGGALLHCQIRLTSQVDRITAKTYDRIRLPQLVRCSSRQCRNGRAGIAPQRGRCVDRHGDQNCCGGRSREPGDRAGLRLMERRSQRKRSFCGTTKRDDGSICPQAIGRSSKTYPF